MTEQGVLDLTKAPRNTRSQRSVRKEYVQWDQGVKQGDQLSELMLIRSQPDPRTVFVVSGDSIESLLDDARDTARDDEQSAPVRINATIPARNVFETDASLHLDKVPQNDEFGQWRIPWDRIAEVEGDPLTQYKLFFVGTPSLNSFRRMMHSTGQVSDVDQDESYRILEASEPDSLSAEGLWAIARDLSTPVEKRVDALCKLVPLQEQNVARYVVDELCRDDLSSNWRNAVIQLAEHCQFEDDTDRARLKGRLLEYATGLRQSTEAGIKYVVYSAIRTYTSLIAFSEASSLLKLLDPPNPVETRLVTLHCIIHLFEKQPPQDEGLFRNLADRVHELAMKFLDKDWLVPGEKAAIGQCATQALAALGDARLKECIERVKSLGRPWVTRQVTRKLESLLATWEMNPNAGRSDIYALVRAQVDVLRR